MPGDTGLRGSGRPATGACGRRDSTARPSWKCTRSQRCAPWKTAVGELHAEEGQVSPAGTWDACALAGAPPPLAGVSRAVQQRGRRTPTCKGDDDETRVLLKVKAPWLSLVLAALVRAGTSPVETRRPVAAQRRGRAGRDPAGPGVSCGRAAAARYLERPLDATAQPRQGDSVSLLVSNSEMKAFPLTLKAGSSRSPAPSHSRSCREALRTAVFNLLLIH